ncbi:MAG: primosomal protein N' [Phycisphaera sp.]|nr:MAG: primosomal protein N' [Phycisphaera sp.]
MTAPGLFKDDRPTPAGPFLAVALERSIDGKTLTYAPPAESEEAANALVGRACMAPLGRGGKGGTPTRGVIVGVGGAELLDGFDPSKVRRLLAVSDARLPEGVLELGRWIAEYYACPLGMTLAAMLPAAVKKAVGRKERVALRPSEPTPNEPLAQARGHQRPKDEGGDPTAIPPARAGGSLKLPPTTKKAFVGLGEIPADAWPLEERDLVHRLGLKNASPIRRLVTLGLLEEITLTDVVARTQDATPLALDTTPAPTPTQEQEAVIDGVPLEGFSTHLLFGVTGSGKTEVYLQLLDRVLASGKSGIVLVPEIALTPQLSSRFIARFAPQLGERGVAVLHSGLSAGQRHRAWDAVSRGLARVVVGPRSALFAPLTNVGLIVVDEEHASDYKQDQAPRYHGRDAAIKRAQIEGCPVLLGSATPSLESWRNAQLNRSTLWRMPTRAPGSAGLPMVEVVDLAEERKASRQRGHRMELLGPTLEIALRQTLDDGGQAVMLLNRRGFARVVACPDAMCGWTLNCDSCSAAMVFHRKGVMSRRGLVRCHHCLAEQMMPKSCPVCAKKTILLGRGTQRLEDELVDMIGLRESEIARMDGDTMNRAADYQGVLTRIADGSIKVLLGTQMIAKGLDFPNIRLVGVVDADTALGIADWRCQERTFQLVSQVAGRAGRGTKPGRVIVQTLSPDLPSIQAAAAHDYERFAKDELEVRQHAHLPPFTRAAWIVARDRHYDKAEARAHAIAQRLHDAFGDKARVEGPAPAPLERAHDEYRVGLEVYAASAGILRDGLLKIRAEHGLVSDAHVAVDVDPVSIW